MKRRSTLALLSMLSVVLLAPAPAHPQPFHPSSSDGEPSLWDYKRAHGYLVGDPARFDRLTMGAAARAGLHPSAADPTGSEVPHTLRSFQGLDQNDLSPPDPTGAAGPHSYIQAINLQLGIYTKNGTLIDSAPFSELTGSGEDFLSDPQVLWDPASNRFYYLILNIEDPTTPNSTMMWGFSKSNRPMDVLNDFCNYETGFGWDGIIADYPKLGQTRDFLLIGVNKYPTLATFTGSDVGWITKPKRRKPFIECPDGGNAMSGVQTMLLNDDGTSLASTPEPAKQVDPSGTGWIVAVPDPTNSGATGNKLELFRVTRAQGGSANIQQVGTPVAVPAYSPPAPAPQRLSAHLIDTLDGRLTNAISAVDPSYASKPVVWTQHTVFGGAGAEVRWYEIDPEAATLVQDGVVSDDSLFVFNGGVSPDRVWRGPNTKGFGDNVVVGFTTSSAATFPAIRMVSKVGNDPQSAFVLIKRSPGADDGFDCFELQRCRWGDYAGASPDPAANLNRPRGVVWLDNMWTTGEINPIAATWATWIWAAVP